MESRQRDQELWGGPAAAKKPPGPIQTMRRLSGAKTQGCVAVRKAVSRRQQPKPQSGWIEKGQTAMGSLCPFPRNAQRCGPRQDFWWKAALLRPSHPNAQRINIVI